MSEYIEKSHFEIKSIDCGGIVFNDNFRIMFSECAAYGAYGNKCIAERDISVTPPYFNFFRADGSVRVNFDKKGFFLKRINHRLFLKFQFMIYDYGYTTFDLS